MATSSENYYKMDHTSRGFAVIIDNYEFEIPSYKKLEGHIHDVRNYKTTFLNLGFEENEIKLHVNQTKEEMIKLMEEYARKDFTNCDCFIAVFLSHGFLVNNKQYIKSSESTNGASFEELTDPFKFNESLFEKPKIFFFDLCRGRKKEPIYSKSMEDNKAKPLSSDEDLAEPQDPHQNQLPSIITSVSTAEQHEIGFSIAVQVTDQPMETDILNEQSDANKFFSQSDFFFGWASVDGYVSFINAEHGSWYSNVLCETLNENYLTKEFQHIMTKVNLNLKKKCTGLTAEPEYTLKKLCFFSQSAQNCYNQSTSLLMPANNLPKCVANFVGRELYLESIESAFLNENKKIVILSSMPGTGKTTLAIEFGYRFIKLDFRNNRVYWFKSDKDNLNSEFLKFAENDLYIKFNDKQKTDKQFVVRQIKNTIHEKQKEEEKVLFIFDNCDDFKSIDDYITLASDLFNCKVLMTTRDDTLTENIKDAKHYQLEPFEEKESIEYIMKEFKLNDTNEAKEIKNLLDFSQNEKIRPIRLNKIIAIIKLSKKIWQTIQDCIKDMKEKRSISKEKVDEKLFKLIIENEPEAWNILKLCAFLDPDFIPFKIFEDFFDLNLNQLENGINFLVKHSLIKIEETKQKDEKPGLIIHRTLQIETKEYMKKTNEFKHIIEMVFKNAKSLFEKKEKKFNKQKYIYHFDKIIEIIIEEESQTDKIKASLTSDFANYLLHFNLNLNNSQKYFDKSLAIYRRIFGTDEHESIATTLNKFTQVYDS